ncbi:SDR family NAD(P)-dependent oxidoreductase, partial [Streptomyces sp. NPDC002537]
PFYSTVTGGLIDTKELDAEYWVTNLRQTVRFDETVRVLLADGFGYFVESSAHPVLTVGLQETFEDSGKDAVALGTLRRDEGGPERFLTSLAEGYVRGLSVDWHAVFAGTGAQRVDLPTYAFQRQRYWLEDADTDEPETVAADAVEAGFWDAVERGDLDGVAAELAVGADQPLSAVLPALSSWRRRRRDASTVDRWRYRVVWRPVPAGPAPTLSGRWLLVVPTTATDHVWAVGSRRALEEHGAHVRRLDVDPVRADRAQLTDLLRDALAEEDTGPVGVLSLLALDETAHPAHPAVPVGLSATVALAQAVIGASEELGVAATLWCATQGAVSVDPAAEPLTRPTQAHIWGLGRVIALEHPLLWGGLIDLPDIVDASAARLAAALAEPGAEDQLAVRPSGTYARRLVHAPAADTPVRRAWKPRGTVLITGGTGGIGGHLARRLARDGARHLLLVGRRGADAPGATELEAELTDLGAEVTLAACDVSDREALARLLDEIPAERPLTAVVHAAAVLDDGVVDSLTPDQMDRVLQVKARGAVNLHQLTRDADLSAFVLCSSFGATFGLPALGNYAPGNAFLDALAEHRRAAGLPATSIAWGTWEGTGMAAGAVGARGRLEGIHEMAPERAAAALQHVLDRDETTAVLIDLRWDRFAPVFHAKRPTSLFTEIPAAVRALAAPHGTGADDPATGGGGPDGLRARLAGLSAGEQRHELLEVVRSHAGVVMGHVTLDENARDAIDPSRPFRELGFDSLMAVELRNRIGATTGLTLPTSLVFDFPTPEAVAEHLRREMGLDDPADTLPGLAELERLEAVLAAARADDETRDRLAKRLEKLLWKWTGSDTAATGTDIPENEFTTVSNDEMFDLIDRELGTL